MIYRQGDVLLVSVDEVPASSKKIQPARVVLAEGEVTGHVHELVGGEVEVFQDKAEALFVRIMAAPELHHAEHSTQVIQPGTYRVVRQREYSPQELRRVAD